MLAVLIALFVPSSTPAPEVQSEALPTSVFERHPALRPLWTVPGGPPVAPPRSPAPDLRNPGGDRRDGRDERGISNGI